MTTETNKPEQPKTKRRWQFSLRTLLIAMVLFCFLFAWGGYKIRQAEKQKEIVGWLKENGGRVMYDFFSEPTGTISAAEYNSLVEWSWLHYHYNVIAVGFSSTATRDSDIFSDAPGITPLYDLPHLEEVSFNRVRPSNSAVRNLQSEFPNCEILWQESFESSKKWCQECNDWNDLDSNPHSAHE